MADNDKDNDNGTLVGFREMMKKAAGMPTSPEVETSSAPVKMADGGDISAALQQLIGNPAQAVGNATQGITQPVGQALGQAFAPAMAPGIQQMAANTASSPALPGVVNAALGTNLPTPGNTPPAQAAMNASAVPPPTPNAAPAAGGTPAIHQIMQTLQQTPATNYDFYKGINADDRAALANKLTQQQHSGGNLVASGAAGLGDAIARSFGHENTNYQNDVEAKAQNAKEQQLGTVDTERGQKMQDMQAKLALQESDPASPYSSGMRQFVTAFTGKRVPSGVSASMLKANFGDIAKIFDSQLVAATTSRGQTIGAQEKGAALTPFEQLSNSIFGNKSQEALENTATGGQSTDNSGWSVVK